MATTPLLTTLLGNLRTAVAGMTTDTYNHTLTSANVTGVPFVASEAPVLPYVGVYAQGDGRNPAVTVKSKDVEIQVCVDVAVEYTGDDQTTGEAVLLLIHDLSQLLCIQRKTTLFGSTNGGLVTAMDQTFNYQGDPDVSDALFSGRLTIALRYVKPQSGGF